MSLIIYEFCKTRQKPNAVTIPMHSINYLNSVVATYGASVTMIKYAAVNPQHAYTYNFEFRYGNILLNEIKVNSPIDDRFDRSVKRDIEAGMEIMTKKIEEWLKHQKRYMKSHDIDHRRVDEFLEEQEENRKQKPR